MKKLVLLDNGSALPCDGLSLDPGPVQDRQKLSSSCPAPVNTACSCVPQRLLAPSGRRGWRPAKLRRALDRPRRSSPGLAGSYPALAAHLAAVVAGMAPTPLRAPRNTLTCWVAWLKDRMDRKTIALYQRS